MGSRFRNYVLYLKKKIEAIDSDPPTVLNSTGLLLPSCVQGGIAL